MSKKKYAHNRIRTTPNERNTQQYYVLHGNLVGSVFE